MIRPRIGKILSDPLYYGHFRYNGEVHRGIHEALISKELFDRVQAVRMRRIRFHPSAKALKPFAYRHTLSCATCGGAVTAESQKGHTYYRCSRKSKRVARCTEPYIREEALDPQIVELLKPYSLKTEWADDMLARIEAEKANATEQAQSLTEENCLKIDTINTSLITLQDGLVDGVFDHEYVRSKRAALMSTRHELEAKNDALSTDATSWLEPFRDFISAARNIALTCSQGTKGAHAELARKIFGSNLVLSSRKARGEAVKPWAIFADNEFKLSFVRALGFEPRTPSVSVMCSTN